MWAKLRRQRLMSHRVLCGLPRSISCFIALSLPRCTMHLYHQHKFFMRNIVLKTAVSGALSFTLISSVAFAARNPAGTGQPGAECGSANALIEPHGFTTQG